MCFSLAKYFLFAFNFVFWLAGAGMLGVGIWLNVDNGTAETIEVAGLSFYVAGAIVMIVAGAIMLIVGFFGCCGAIKESTCLLGVYFGFLFVVLGIEVGLGIWAFVTYPDLKSGIDASFNALNLNESKPNPTDPIVATEQNLECCGALTGCEDWKSSTYQNVSSYGCACDPNSVKNETNCVIAVEFGCEKDSNTETNPKGLKTIFRQPCNDATYNFIEDNFLVLAYVTLIIGCTQVVGLILSGCLCCSIKDKKKGI